MTEYFLKTRLKVAYFYQAESRKKGEGLFPFPYGATHLICYYGNNY